MLILTRCCCLLLAALTIGHPLTASAERFFLQDGNWIDGTVTRALGSTVTIKLKGRGMHQLPMSVIERVEIVLASGEEIAGQFVDWDKETYHLKRGDRLLSVRDGEIVLDVAEAGGVGRADPVDGIGGSRGAPAETVDTVPEDAEMATAVVSVPHLTGSVEPTNEGAGEIVFRLEISQAVDRSLVVIYTAVDQSAIGGSDFEKKAGVLTIAAGARSAEIAIPLIDDDQPETDEGFALFLTVDPETATTDARRLVATIRDDDS